MFVTILVGIFAVLFAFLDRSDKIKWGLKASFILIFLFLALRYNFGNDYHGYLTLFNKIKVRSLNVIFDQTIYGEPGWKLLNWIFKPFGFFAMTAVLALLNCAIYYHLIKKYLPIELYWLAVFLYIFNPGFMLTHSSAMRQSLAIGLFLFSIDYLLKKDVIRYFLCIGFASLFHNSALILLLVYLLSYFNWKINWSSGIIIIAIFISLFIFQKYLSININLVVANYFQKYKIYKGGIELGTGLGMVYSILLFTLIIYYDRLQDQETAMIFKLAMISFLFIPLSFIIMLIGRVGMYFAPATIIVYPIILMNLKKPLNKIIFITLLLFMTTYSFFQFFNSDIWKAAFGTYQTIFSAPEIY